jgi:hypothetical protein
VIPRANATIVAALLYVVIAPVAVAQTPENTGETAPPTTLWTVRDWTRVEWWRFFEPHPGGGDNEYVYPANRLQIGVTRRATRYALTGAIQYVQFANLPRGAVGPGPLGLGAVYFGHAGRSNSRQVYLRYLNAEFRNLIPGVGIQIGRMPYSSGAEGSSGNPTIEAVKQQRVAARLVGEFEWSLFQRAYDGLRIDSVRQPWSATVVALRPTQGGFEDAAGLMMRDVTVLGGNVTLKPDTLLRGTELQLFAFRYDDERNVTARPDNSGREATRVDVGVTTLGATLVAASHPRDGRQWDGLVWFAAQTGSWFDQSHSAASGVVEGGHHWGASRWQPWIRGGFTWASGDGNPSDDRHGTFFQMLPTVRRYAQSAIYSQMNHTDVFVQALVRPTPSLGVRTDFHRVGLASSRDHWYFGSGATQARGTLFGFSTRPSNGHSDLGTIVETSGEYSIGPHWSVNAYIGAVRGGRVVQQDFAGRTMTFSYVENVVQF